MTKLFFTVLLVSCSVVLSQYQGFGQFTPDLRKFASFGRSPRPRPRPNGNEVFDYDGHLKAAGNLDKLRCYSCFGCNDPFQYPAHSPSGLCNGVCVKIRFLSNSPPSIREITYAEGDILRDCFCADGLCSKAEKGSLFETALRKEEKLSNDSSGCKTEETMGHKLQVCYCKESLCNGTGEFSVSITTVVMAVAAILSSFYSC